ncbi:MAG: fibronectin type III-like domain-contianing protein, partial [Flavobacteriaceae bacterium]
GADKEVHFSIPFEELKWYNPVSKQWELEAMTYEVYVGNSSAIDSLEQSQFTID